MSNKTQTQEMEEYKSESTVAGIIIAFMFFVFVTGFAALIVFANSWN
jgi:hypothetical protein